MKRILLTLALLLGFTLGAHAQSPSPVPAIMAQGVQGYYGMQNAVATNAINTQTTLTIPAPGPGLYNYICSLNYNYSQSATTGTVQTNAVTTSTNFNSFALKYSIAQAINTTYEKTLKFGTPAGGGCARSTSPATATTFVSPAAAAQGMMTWYATYFQAP